MTFLANIGATFLFIFGSLWSGTLGVLHLSPPVATSTPQTVQNSQTSATTTIFDTQGNATGLYKDISHVYFSGDIITGADPHTFAFVGYSVINDLMAGGYYKDKNYVYWSERQANTPTVIAGADTSTFQIENPSSGAEGPGNTVSCGQGCYYDAQDKNHKYLEGQIVQDNSQTSATTTILDAQGQPSFYFKDAQHVYWNGSDDPNYKPLLVSNYPDSFVALGSHDLYSDGHQVFQAESISPDLVLSNDAAHFQLISSSTNQYIVAKDSSYYYMSSHQSLQLTPTQHPEEWLNQTTLGQ